MFEPLLVLRRFARYLMVGVLCGSVSGCLQPSDLGYREVSAFLRLEEHRFGVLVYPCARGQIASIELSLLDLSSREETPVLREEFGSPVDAEAVMMTTGVDDPPFNVDSKRTVFDADLLERFNSDESFAVGEDGRFGVVFVVRALDVEGVDQAGMSDAGTAWRFIPDVGMVVIDSISPNEPLDSFTCPQDDQQAWHLET